LFVPGAPHAGLVPAATPVSDRAAGLVWAPMRTPGSASPVIGVAKSGFRTAACGVPADRRLVRTPGVAGPPEASAPNARFVTVIGG